MSNLWPHFTKESPCPACNHYWPDWTCRAGTRKFLCMRVQSDHPSKDGGWYHDYGDKKPAYIPPKTSAAKVNLDFYGLIDGYHQNGTGIADSLARELGVCEDSLLGLEAVYSEKDKAWAIPMRDGDNKIIGIHLRCDDGTKKAVLGSRNGLFLPQGIEPQKVAHIVEGASNTAAMLTMGFYAIGRPSCNSGGEMLKVALKRLGVSRIVIVADNDPIKNDRRAGQDGAKKLKKELGLMSVIFTAPNPVKDCRELLIKLGVDSARNYIQESVDSKVWARV